ncbi:MAG TPA: M23 family metallopeptidase, partial [Cyclobacteriaceae bacterium]|nr:M23 family metallopeptidase [Cyclobacteriaceae bacterium]
RFIDKDGFKPWPVNETFNGFKRWISSWFGPRNVKDDPEASTYHPGLDINFGGGTDDFGAPVMTTHDGEVTIKDSNTGRNGRTVWVTSPDGKFRTVYMHLSAITVKAGEEIHEGDQVGKIGRAARGSETGVPSHLHYQIEKLNEATGQFEIYNPTEGKENTNANIIDPQKWIDRPETRGAERVEYGPAWARSNALFAHIYFLFTGRDPSLPIVRSDNNTIRANANKPDIVPDPRFGFY